MCQLRQDQMERIVIDPDVPPGLIYRIQLAVFRNPVAGLVILRDLVLSMVLKLKELIKLFIMQVCSVIC